ncbi:RING-H2 finger protein ATL80 [Pistacia vera]|uniref:RING-H2 finger protein ATL80 n=1 Tax=Pistacia vera TaxID=55513 RepID=UPI0012631BD1|nr:RING-H2 finger protein ATL80 [Pistacia vera]
MTRPFFRFLGGENSTNPGSAEPANVDSDYVVILAALLCALICVLGLIAVARCAWLRRLSSGANNSAGTTSATARRSPANKGLKKKILRSLPKLAFNTETAAKFSDCAICLTEFAIGDEIRILPQCGHGFHVACIDTWLGSHSSCPSCRQILVVARCQKCGGVPPASSSSSDAAPETSEARLKEREDDANR